MTREEALENPKCWINGTPFDECGWCEHFNCETCKCEADAKSDIISRADALEQMAQAECGLHYEDCEADNCSCSYIKRILDLPSVSANSDDLIIKNGKGIQDGLYNIKDGEIFKYKAKGGTVRAYKLVPSVSAERVGEWTAEIGYEGEVLYYECSNCKEAFSLLEGTPEENKYNYCPNCGARMGNDDDDLDGLKIIAIIDGKGGAE